jgi:deazaflavin-dependent oxidoreductase (nitroreductase family)
MNEINRTAIRAQWRLHKLAWNLTDGRIGRRVIGMPVLELVTIGRKSGEPRQILITYVEFDGAPAIIGTNAGSEKDPAWVGNLRVNPDARARWDGVWHDVTAIELTGEQHDEVWEAAVRVNPGYADYANDLTRPIPIVHLRPR